MTLLNMLSIWSFVVLKWTTLHLIFLLFLTLILFSASDQLHITKILHIVIKNCFFSLQVSLFLLWKFRRSISWVLRRFWRSILIKVISIGLHIRVRDLWRWSIEVSLGCWLWRWRVFAKIILVILIATTWRWWVHIVIIVLLIVARVLVLVLWLLILLLRAWNWLMLSVTHIFGI